MSSNKRLVYVDVSNQHPLGFPDLAAAIEVIV